MDKCLKAVALSKKILLWIWDLDYTHTDYTSLAKYLKLYKLLLFLLSFSYGLH